jgi:hypothetical protein
MAWQAATERPALPPQMARSPVLQRRVMPLPTPLHSVRAPMALQGVARRPLIDLPAADLPAVTRGTTARRAAARA